MSEREINYVRQQGKKYIKDNRGRPPPEQEEKLIKEHAYEMNKNNVCPTCRTVKSKRGKCMCE